jgi:hypothetical protein
MTGELVTVALSLVVTGILLILLLVAKAVMGRPIKSKGIEVSKDSSENESRTKRLQRRCCTAAEDSKVESAGNSTTQPPVTGVEVHNVPLPSSQYLHWRPLRNLFFR